MPVYSEGRALCWLDETDKLLLWRFVAQLSGSWFLYSVRLRLCCSLASSIFSHSSLCFSLCLFSQAREKQNKQMKWISALCSVLPLLFLLPSVTSHVYFDFIQVLFILLHMLCNCERRRCGTTGGEGYFILYFFKRGNFPLPGIFPKLGVFCCCWSKGIMLREQLWRGKGTRDWPACCRPTIHNGKPKILVWNCPRWETRGSLFIWGIIQVPWALFYQSTICLSISWGFVVNRRTPSTEPDIWQGNVISIVPEWMLLL